MNKINRRKFIEKALLYNGSIVLGGMWFAPTLENLFFQSASDYYLPIQSDNPAIARYEKKCKGCRECITVCKEVQKVYGSYKASKTHHVCIHCGACISRCNYGALSEKYNWENVLETLEDPSKIVIASISPSVPAGIGDYFDMPAGSYLSENIVAACRDIGFDFVLDTNFSADLTIMEEAHELQKRIEGKVNMPQFTSCCPSWVKYLEIFYPSLIKHLSTTRSPISMQGAMIKTYFAQKKGINPANIVHVAITPCTSKKYEITREELTTNGQRSTDFAITTNELALMLKSRNIDLSAKKDNYDQFMGTSSGGGKLFGSTGGVMSAAIRTAHFNMTGKNPSADLLQLNEIQGLNGLKSAKVNIGGSSLNVAVCYEMRNAQVLLEQVANGTCSYDFIEVMACKGGCIGGAGQPTSDTSTLEARIRALNTADSQAATRFSHENPEIISIYKDFIGEPGSEVSEQYLHTHYTDKSALLEPILAQMEPEPAF